MALPVAGPPVTMLSTPARKARFEREFSEAQGGERRLLRRLYDDGVSAGEGRTQLPGGQQKREIPRNDQRPPRQPAHAGYR